MAKIAALALAASLLGGWEPANEGGEKHQKEEERGVWHLYTVANPFGDPEGWFAASPTVDGTGEVRFSCSTSGGFGVAGRPMLKAFAEGLGAEALDYGRLEAMAVHVRVDGGEADRVAGFRPNVLAMMEERPLDGYESGNDTVRMLQGGRKAVLRIEDPAGMHVRETWTGEVVSRQGSGLTHTFAVSLDGFREASSWVMGRCGWKGK